MTKKTIPEEIQEGVLDDLRDTTMSVKYIAAVYDMDISTVYRIAKRAGVDMKKRGRGVQLLRKAIKLHKDVNAAYRDAMDLLEESKVWRSRRHE